MQEDDVTALVTVKPEQLSLAMVKTVKMQDWLQDLQDLE